jgi:hypothetical protein
MVNHYRDDLLGTFLEYDIILYTWDISEIIHISTYTIYNYGKIQVDFRYVLEYSTAQFNQILLLTRTRARLPHDTSTSTQSGLPALRPSGAYMLESL